MQQNTPTAQINVGRDSYDDCVADLDEQLGRLIDELDRRSVLDKTWVIITADHGESFGENPGVFWHGTSLYQTQLHVPLVIVPPKGGPSPQIVKENVSLRDLAATIVDMVGAEADSPFPGNSLARFWESPLPEGSLSVNDASAHVLSEVVPLTSFGHDPSQFFSGAHWPMACLSTGDWIYIRQEEKPQEELFRARDDVLQRQNLAGHPELKPTLERLRAELNQLTKGPLTPDRFNP
jgi:arylsulfatase A-like enzyme